MDNLWITGQPRPIPLILYPNFRPMAKGTKLSLNIGRDAPGLRAFLGSCPGFNFLNRRDKSG